MFTKPTSCCLCINLRLATLLLALAQTICCGIQSYTIFTSGGDDLATQICLFTSLLLTFIGVYGAYGVYKENLKLVRVFAIYYWAEFIASLAGMALYSVSSANDSSEFCFQATTDAEEFNYCKQNFDSLFSTAMTLFFLFSIVRVHYCFSIWAYYRKLEAKSKALVEEIQAPKVIYPQYVFIGMDEKTQL